LKQPEGLKTIEEYEQLAMLERKDLGALSFRKKAADLGIKSVNADYYPSLALTGWLYSSGCTRFCRHYKCT
jgi:outer membrane protein TolC